MTSEFPGAIGAPAARAITRVGILGWADLSDWAEEDLAELHGVGPTAIGLLRNALAAKNKSFAAESSASGRAAVDEFLALVPEPQQTTLRAVRERLLALLPSANEKLSYSMPAVTVGGAAVAGYDSFKNHCGYFAHSGTVIGTAGDAIAAYKGSASGIHFAHDKPLPKRVLKVLVDLKLAELAGTKGGTRIETFGNGQVKAIGPMKKGEPDGTWKWFRKDGSLLRSGSFKAGKQTRTWVTYAADGDIDKIIQF